MDPIDLKLAIANFLADLRQSKSPHTFENYQRYLKNFSHFVHDLSVSELNTQHLNRYRSYLSHSDPPMAISSQNYHLTALRQFILYLHSRNLTTLDADLIKLHSEPKQTSPLASVDLNSPKITADNVRDQLILSLLRTTGLKVSEVVALDRSDIMPNFRQLTAGRSRKQRTLLLEPSISLTLEKYLKTRRDTAAPLFIRLKINRQSSARLTPRTIQRIVQKFSRSSHSSATPSTLRNQFAANLFAEGMNTTEANQLLGHSHKSSTAHYKSKLDQARLEPS